MDKGIREVVPPQEDMVLKQMKCEYAEKKTQEVASGIY